VIRSARPVEPPAVCHVEHRAQDGQAYSAAVRAVVPRQAVGAEQGTGREPFDRRETAQRVAGRLAEEQRGQDGRRRRREREHRVRRPAARHVQVLLLITKIILVRHRFRAPNAVETGDEAIPVQPLAALQDASIGTWCNDGFL